jgi:hypothetical protein
MLLVSYYLLPARSIIRSLYIPAFFASRAPLCTYPLTRFPFCPDWTLLSADLNFVYLDPVLSYHLVDQADLLIGQSLLKFVHPDEQASAKNDLGNVLKTKAMHGSVTRYASFLLPRGPPPRLMLPFTIPITHACLPSPECVIRASPACVASLATKGRRMFGPMQIK